MATLPVGLISLLVVMRVKLEAGSTEQDVPFIIQLAGQAEQSLAVAPVQEPGAQRPEHSRGWMGRMK